MAENDYLDRVKEKGKRKQDISRKKKEQHLPKRDRVGRRRIIRKKKVRVEYEKYYT